MGDSIADFELFKTIVKNTTTGVAVWELEDLNDEKSLIFKYYNQAAEKASGTSFEGFIGKYIGDIFPPLMETELPKIYQQVVLSKSEFDFGEVNYSDENIDLGTFLVKAFYLKDNLMAVAYENVSVLKGVQKDLEKTNSELETLANDLEESNKRLFEFASIASHDMKSPTRGVKNLINFFIEDYGEKLDDTGIELLNRVIGMTDKMEVVIDNLLSSSKVKNIQDSYEKIGLDIISQKTYERVLIEDPDLNFIIGDLPIVNVDRTRLLEVFYNLATNAIKYNTSEKKRIEITFDSKTGILKFTDNGIGIRKQDYDNVFKLHKRLNEDQYKDGTGVGMALAKGILDRHGIDISIDSEVGRGTSFLLNLNPVLAN